MRSYLFTIYFVLGESSTQQTGTIYEAVILATGERILKGQDREIDFVEDEKKYIYSVEATFKITKES